jgi:hypothetical protein
MFWEENPLGPPFNDDLCRWENSWAGEFTVETEQTIRLYSIWYRVVGGDGDLIPGWVRPHWCTGEALAYYQDDGGDQVLETRAIEVVSRSGACTPMIDSTGQVAREEVEYKYRIRAVCYPSTGHIETACIQHIYPDCHQLGSPLFGRSYYLADAENLTGVFRICQNHWVASFDIDFGRSHYLPSYDDGEFSGAQFDAHYFAGCNNELNVACSLPNLSNYPGVVAYFTW